MFTLYGRHRPFRSGAAGTLVLAATLALVASSASAEEVRVKIDNFSFGPETLTIKPGDKVTWENGDDIPHNIVSSDKTTFRSKVMDTEESFSFTFTTVGSFEYFCALHPHMKGMIVVAP